MSHVADDPGTGTRERRRPWGVAASVAFYVLAALAVWFVWPSSLGGCTTLTIVSGHSMEPTYRTGDLVVSRCGAPQVGDVVVYEPPGHAGARIIHRLVGGDGTTGWVVQGDNNAWTDPFTPTNRDVVGRALVHVPRVGLVARVVTTPLVWASLLVLAVALFVWPQRDDEDDDAPGADPADDLADDRELVGSAAR